MDKPTLESVWYCVVYSNNRDGTRTNHVLHPFGVTASNIHEAIGKATKVMYLLQREFPSEDFWAVRVNELGKDGLIINPDAASFSRKGGKSNG